MSSILDALKKLEEEKQRQLKLLEKEEEEEFSEPISISTIAKSDSPLPLQETTTRFISPKFLVMGLVILIIAISIISVSASLWVVKKQIAKNTTAPVSTEVTTLSQKTVEVTTSPPSKEEIPPQNISIDKKETASVSPENRIENKPQESIVSESAPATAPVITPPEKVQQAVPPLKEKVPEEPVKVEQSAVTPEPPLQVARSTPSEPPKPVVEEVKKDVPPPTPASQFIEEPPQQTMSESPSPEVSSSPVNTQNTQTNGEMNTKEPQKVSTPPPPETKPVSSSPVVVTKDLEPPPSLKPEQFQQTLPLPKPKTEETVDMTRLPVLRTSDRARLGLEDMKLNVLREAGPKNPHGLAIINLTKVYVGEMIPGTSVRLLDVKTHGIAIEVVGTGERYYVPR